MSSQVKTTDDRLRIQWEVEQFLYEEAALLAERRFEDWYALIAEDIHYAVPAREVRILKDIDKQFLPLSKGAHFDDNYKSLGMRVKKLYDHRTWVENPPMYQRTAVTNVRVRETDVAGEYEAYSNIAFTRSRLEKVYPPLIGYRHDLVRRSDGPLGFRLARRTVYLDHAVLPGSGISTFL
ncbi:aromatic-ring-hydroxylating dioxygenase subunit beta [Sphingobium aromaticiconvertens]|uniref:aromatic-ring-hydroxylating dioxygenase subunit beta n=1 Tax=Sphingobium aromaticiconvertens TaxID=365341 RepID=UPI003016C1D6